MKIYYVEGNTYFHKVDPISKLVWGIMVAIFLMGQTDIKIVLITSLIVLVISLKGASIPLISYLKSVLLLMLAGIWLILFQGWVRPGPGFELWGIHLSKHGLEVGLAIMLRTFGLIAAALAFSTTTSPKKLSLAMVGIGIPYKFAHVAYMALRFMPMFESDLQILLDAQRLRGIRHGKDKFLRTLRAMLITQLRRVDITAIALETRGFGLYSTRTELDHAAINRYGIILNLVTVLLVVIYTYITKFVLE